MSDERNDVVSERLTFPFPFVRLQPLDCKLEQLLTVETKSRVVGLERDLVPRVVPVKIERLQGERSGA